MVALASIYLVFPQMVAAQGNVDYSRLFFEAVLLIESENGLFDQTSTSAPNPDTPSIEPSISSVSGTGITAQQFNSISQYQSSILALEEAGGPYAEGLSEEFEALGSLYQEIGNHELAIETFEKAMHILRVNNGLFTLNQMPVVRQIIDSYRALDNFDELDNHNEYQFYINQKNFDENDPIMIVATKKWADWNIMASFNEFNDANTSPLMFGGNLTSNQTTEYILVRGPNNTVTYIPRNQSTANWANFTTMSSVDLMLGPRLKKARDLYESILEVTSEDNPEYTAILVDSQRNLAGIHHVVKQQIDNQESMMTSSNLFYNRVSLHQGTSLLESRSYARGKKALQSSIELLKENPESTSQEIASAFLDLADWYLSFDRFSLAARHYGLAVEQLNAAGFSSQEVSNFFSPEPALKIPTYAIHPYTRDSLSIPDDEEVVYKGFIDVELTLNRYGRARGSKIIAYSPDTATSIRRSLTRDLRSSTLRPKFLDGNLVSQENLKLRYYYSY